MYFLVLFRTIATVLFCFFHYFRMSNKKKIITILALLNIFNHLCTIYTFLSSFTSFILSVIFLPPFLSLIPSHSHFSANISHTTKASSCLSTPPTHSRFGSCFFLSLLLLARLILLITCRFSLFFSSLPRSQASFSQFSLPPSKVTLDNQPSLHFTFLPSLPSSLLPIPLPPQYLSPLLAPSQLPLIPYTLLRHSTCHLSLLPLPTMIFSPFLPPPPPPYLLLFLLPKYSLAPHLHLFLSSSNPPFLPPSLLSLPPRGPVAAAWTNTNTQTYTHLWG